MFLQGGNPLYIFGGDFIFLLYSAPGMRFIQSIYDGGVPYKIITSNSVCYYQHEVQIHVHNFIW